ncbi:hypothetical protein QY895_07640 [Latilactobacillus sakei]
MKNADQKEPVNQKTAEERQYAERRAEKKRLIKLSIGLSVS